MCNYYYNVEKDPQTLVINDGDEDIQQIKRKKQLVYGYGDKPKNIAQEAPAEVIRARGEDLVIRNFDVDYEEEDPDLRMLGGIRGIRALRVQR